MKRKFFRVTGTVLIAVFMLSLTACAMKNNSGMATEPTGYSDGRFEVSYLYMNGKLYQPALHYYSFEKRSEAEKYLEEKGYEAVGKITKCDPYRLPDADYTATDLEVGTALYYSEKDDEAAAINEAQQKIEYFTQVP